MINQTAFVKSKQYEIQLILSTFLPKDISHDQEIAAFEKFCFQQKGISRLKPEENDFF